MGWMRYQAEPPKGETMDLAEAGERVDIIAVGDSFAIKCKRQELAQAEVREVTNG